MKDQSILNSAKIKGESYLDDLAFAVCVNGESLEKYQKIVEKKYGTDVYSNMVQFANTLHQQVARRQFTNTSLLSLKHLGKNAGMSEDAIDMITDYFDSKINEEQRIHEEEEYWNKCNHNDKQSLKDYLKKYPNSIYAIQARSKIAEIERIERDAIEESRMFNQCRSKSDYLDYLQKYPNGYYRNKAMYEIDMLYKASQEERNSFIQEQETYEQCKTKYDYQRYLILYPNGKFAARAKNKIEHLEKIEKFKEKQQQELSTDDQNDLTEKESLDTVPDEIQRMLKILNKIAGYSYGIAALAFAFLPNAFRGNHWAYLEMEEYGAEPTLWLFWLSIVVSIWCCFASPSNDVFSSIHKTHYVMNGSLLLNAVPCFGMLIWMLIAGHNVYTFFVFYLESIHVFFMGPIICGISWCVGLYCEYKMSRIAKNLDSRNNNQSMSN